jgi:hypothetical protein
MRDRESDLLLRNVWVWIVDPPLNLFADLKAGRFESRMKVPRCIVDLRKPTQAFRGPL